MLRGLYECTSGLWFETESWYFMFECNTMMVFMSVVHPDSRDGPLTCELGIRWPRELWAQIPHLPSLCSVYLCRNAEAGTILWNTQIMVDELLSCALTSLYCFALRTGMRAECSSIRCSVLEHEVTTSTTLSTYDRGNYTRRYRCTIPNLSLASITTNTTTFE